MESHHELKGKNYRSLPVDRPVLLLQTGAFAAIGGYVALGAAKVTPFIEEQHRRSQFRASENGRGS
jgi:hypothetical protein